MDNNIKEMILKSYSKMNKLEKAVAKKVLEESREVVHMSINEVAKFCDVSDTTVFRFCNKLGFKGFQEFKINLALGIVSPMENIHGDITEQDDNYIIMEKVLESTVKDLKKTLKSNSPENIQTLCDHIVGAETVCFWGNGGSGVLAEDAYHKFFRLGLNVQTSSDLHWQYMQASLLQKGDVVIGFSNTGANKDLLDIVDYAKSKGAFVAVFTQSDTSSLAQKSDICVLSCGNDQEYRSEAMESRLSALMMIDVIFIRCSIMLGDRAQENLKNIRQGVANRRI